MTQSPSKVAAWLSGLPSPGWTMMGLITLFYVVAIPLILLSDLALFLPCCVHSRPAAI